MKRRTILVLTIAATLVLLGGLALRRRERLRAEQEMHCAWHYIRMHPEEREAYLRTAPPEERDAWLRLEAPRLDAGAP
jgi:hypothetical protein